MINFNYKCPECGKGIVKAQAIVNFETKIDSHPFVVPKAIVGVCDRCDTKNYDPQERKRWIRLYNEYQQRTGFLLKPEEITELREQLGLTMENFANLIGATRQSIYNWEDKHRKAPQTGSVNLLLKLIRRSIFREAKDIIDFLVEESKKEQVDIVIRPDIERIVCSSTYRTIPHPKEAYENNFTRPSRNQGFYPKLRILHS